MKIVVFENIMTNKQIKFPSSKAPITPNVKLMLGEASFLLHSLPRMFCTSNCVNSRNTQNTILTFFSPKTQIWYLNISMLEENQKIIIQMIMFKSFDSTIKTSFILQLVWSSTRLRYTHHWPLNQRGTCAWPFHIATIAHKWTVSSITCRISVLIDHN